MFGPSGLILGNKETTVDVQKNSGESKAYLNMPLLPRFGKVEFQLDFSKAVQENHEFRVEVDILARTKVQLAKFTFEFKRHGFKLSPVHIVAIAAIVVVFASALVFTKNYRSFRRVEGGQHLQRLD